jgi:splicing factor 3B subunit 2
MGKGVEIEADSKNKLTKLERDRLLKAERRKKNKLRKKDEG